MLDEEGRIVNVSDWTSWTAASPTIHSIVNPAKLAHLGETSDLGLRPSARRS